jgi:hypothetical protein
MLKKNDDTAILHIVSKETARTLWAKKKKKKKKKKKSSVGRLSETEKNRRL